MEGQTLDLDKLVFRQVENLEVFHLGEDLLRHRRKPVLGQKQLLQRRQAAEASGLEGNDPVALQVQLSAKNEMGVRKLVRKIL